MLVDAQHCTGCGSCAAVCPKNCISMEADAEGFRQPVMDHTKCIQCKLCESACPIVHPASVSQAQSAFAVQNTDESVRKSSSSGGVFTALAADVLCRGGKVCAAVYDDDHAVVHSFAETPSQLAPMRGAKYAQSRAEHCFSEIQSLLGRGVPVMFVGTPCQAAGLLAYLGGKPSNLLLVDMICHGVPSAHVWKEYLADRIRQDAPGSQIHSIHLRNKSSGWSHYRYSVEITYTNGTVYCVPQNQDPFMCGFTSNLFLRPSCSDCQFKGIRRHSDLTLADYWGIWDQYPDFDDNCGTSLVIAHTQAGLDILNRLSSQFRSMPVPIQEAIAQNPSAVSSSLPHRNREHFFSGLSRTASVSSWIHQCLAPKTPGLLRRLLHKLRK